MFKKSLIFLLALTANILAIANPTIKIGSYETEIPVDYAKFAEPVVAVYDGSIMVSKNYTITYSIQDGVESVDERGVVIVTDPVTGATVEKDYGNVISSKAGNVDILITATPKDATAKVLTSTYRIKVTGNEAVLSFYPNFQASSKNDGAMALNTSIIANSNNTAYYIAAATGQLPLYKITTTVNGKTIDITDYYDVNIALSKNDKITFANNTLTYSGLSNCNDINKSLSEIEAEIEALNNNKTTLTYNFTTKSQYTGFYNNFTKTIDVNVNVNTTGEKSSLHLSLDRINFNEENVTLDENNLYTIHVYKFGQSDMEGNSQSNIQYSLPTPAILTSTGAQLDASINHKNEEHFKYYYKIVEEGTYLDDCWHGGQEIKAGETIGLVFNEGTYFPASGEKRYCYFQVPGTRTGLAKIAVYAIFIDENKGAELKKLYKPATDDNGNVIMVDGHTAYTQPVYFYIDIMKRVPTLQFTPDPNTIAFAKGDKIYIPERFEVSAYMDVNSNGVEGYLEWNPESSGYWKDGKEVNTFDYSFFISDRMNNHYIRVNNWPETANRNFEDYCEASKMAIGTAVQVGDKILVDGNYVIITEQNIADYADRKLQEGDYEHGMTYMTMKLWGNERWTIEFLATGKYAIPYTIRPWNHYAWDDGGNHNEMTFEVTGVMDTKIDLSYYYQTANKGMGDNFDEPEAKVIVPSLDNLDVTEKYDFSFSLKNVKLASSHTEDDEATNDNSYGAQLHIKTTKYLKGNRTLVEEVTKYYTTSVWEKGKEIKTTHIISCTQEDKSTGTILNTVTGNLIIGEKLGRVVVNVHATRNTLFQSASEVYENPADVTYTVQIVDKTDEAKYEVISTDKGCVVNRNRFTDAEANGRFHFYKAGAVYGGTAIKGVPGITMSIGALLENETATTDWSVEETEETTLQCCQHDGDKRVSIQCSTPVTFDADTKLPKEGAFYKFNPTVNGFLTVDAKYNAGKEIILICKNSHTGEFDKETVKFDKETVGDYSFIKPLLADETYYLYNNTDGTSINLHGFAYQPAYIVDRTTTLEESKGILEGTTFINSLTRSLPTIVNNNYSQVEFNIGNVEESVATEAYLTIDNAGKLTPISMTMNGNGDIFNLKVNATVKSTDASLGDCVNKTSYYKVKVIDIPTYSVGDNNKTVKENYEDFTNNLGINVGSEVTTTNIKTDIIMTYGGWGSEKPNLGEYVVSGKTITDDWAFKNVEPADRIGVANHSELSAFNKTIDGFDFFAAGAANPLDELKKSPLHEGQYNSASGAEYETEENAAKFATTYDLPCYGNYLKFEPRESGTVLVYLVQNGCCSYYEGMDKPTESSFKIKWLPLYITDETGRPATMVNNFDNPRTGDFLPTGKDKANSGSYTLGVSRCNMKDTNIESLWNYSACANTFGTSFDWTGFSGNAEDRQMVIDNWKNTGERMSIIRLDDGGFVLPQKAYVRYAFQVKAGKTYFVFQPGSKFEFGGFSFVPTGFPNHCKYGLKEKNGKLENDDNMEKNIDGGKASEATNSFTWMNSKNEDGQVSKLTQDIENLTVDINDRSNDLKMKERYLEGGTLNGICLPFSVSANELKKRFGNYTLLTISGVSNDMVHLVIHANKYIEAGRPYFIIPEKKDKDNKYLMHFENVSIEGGSLFTFMDGDEQLAYQAIDPSRFEIDLGDDYSFKGTYVKENLPAYSYFAGDENFCQFSFDSTIGGYRSYIRLNNSDASSNSAKALRFGMANMEEEDATEDTVTGILIVDKAGNMSTVEDDVTIYNTNGQVIGKGADAFNSAAHGIYIMNGKKFIK